MRNRGPDDRRRRQARRVSFAAGALLSAAAVWLSTWQEGLSRDAVGAHRSVQLAGAGAIVAMLVLGRRRQRRTSRAWAARTVRLTWGWQGQPREIRISVLMWCAVIVGVIGWDLFSFVVQSSSFPTLSTLVGHVTRYPVGRGILFALWLVVGVYAVAGSCVGSRR